MPGRKKSDVDELIDTTVRCANRLLVDGERLLCDKTADEARMRAAMEELIITGKKLKDISSGIVPDKYFAVRKANLNMLGDSLCTLSGRIYLHLMGMIGKGTGVGLMSDNKSV